MKNQAKSRFFWYQEVEVNLFVKPEAKIFGDAIL